MTRVLELGGIEPLSRQSGERSQQLTAAGYLLGGRRIVRLVPEPLVAAEDLSLATIGAEPAYRTTVGVTAQRAIGFPAWPIISDPANARHALNLVSDLEWARRRAGSEKKKVKDRFDQLAADLSSAAPHFVPTLLEEAARIFAAVDNPTFARQMFNKARETERSHNLPVDSDRHRVMFEEFTALGVVGIKELRAEARAVSSRFNDRVEAFTYLLEINAIRLRAGEEPYNGLLKDLRAVGATAGLSAAEADDSFFDAVLDSPGFLYMSAAVFKTLRGSLVRYAGERPEARRLLLAAAPTELHTDDYLSLLEDCGALPELRLHPTAWGDWLLDLIAKAPTRANRQQLLVPEILIAKDTLAGRQVEIYLGYLDPDVIDALAEVGVTVTAAAGGSWRNLFNWRRWLDRPEGAPARALDHVAASPLLGEQARQTLSVDLIRDYATTLLTASGARRILEARLEEYLTQRDGQAQSVLRLREFLFAARSLAQPELARQVPDLLRSTLSFDAPELLQRSVRGGVLAELAWPALEESIRRLCAKTGTETYRLFESYPAVAVLAGEQVEIIDGDQVVLAGDLPEGVDLVFGILQVGESAVIYFRGQAGAYFAHWLPQGETSQVQDWGGGHGNVSYSLPVPGGRLTAQGHLAVGDTELFADRGNISAQLIRERGWHTLGLDIPAEDPRTRMKNEHSTFVPSQPGTTDSPLGTVKGMHAQIHLTCDGEQKIITPFGTFDARGCLAVVRRPGGGFWLRDHHRLIDTASGRDLDLTGYNATPMRMVEHLPVAGLHQTRPRDESASLRMRSYGREQAAALLDAVTADDDTAAQLLADHLETSEPELIDAILVLARAVATLVGEYAELRMAAGLDTAPEAPAGPECVLSAALAQMINPHAEVETTDQVHQQVAEGIPGIIQLLQHQDLLSDGPHGLDVNGWVRIVGDETLLVARAFGPLTRRFWDTTTRHELTDLIRRLIDVGLLCGEWRTAFLIDPRRYNRASTAPTSAVVDGALTFGWHGYWSAGNTRNYPVLLRDNRVQLAGVELRHLRRRPLSGAVLRKVLDALDTLVDPIDTAAVEVDMAAVEKVAAHTGLLPETLLYLLSRTPGYHPYEPMNKTTRELCGFTTTQAKAVYRQVDELRGHWEDIVSTAVPVDDPVSFLHGAIDADAIITWWRQEFGVPTLRMTAEDHACLTTGWNDSPHLVIDVLTPVAQSTLPEAWRWETLAYYLSTLLQIAQLKTWGDTDRIFLATKLRWLKNQVEHRSDAHHHLSDAELGAAYTDPRLTGAAEPQEQGIRVLLEGHLDNLIEDLQQEQTSTGCPWDPRNSAPDTVRAVATQHDLPEDAAAYYLQVLALVEPTDRNIRTWNRWRKKDIDAAATPLVDRGLLLEATRPGAGRTRFLPGGWLPAASGTKAMEAWKAPLYLLWQDAKARPVLPASPLLSTHRQVFTDVWRRINDDDAPGYEELDTTPYRRR